eukprot:GHVL01034238.1.p1 GENE.GHVL01034238.1~~GHVL01034238.1.p1  ORF type:complete len:107 (+),score=21.06 GHVL01034238.1:1-321(+)
MGGMPGGMGGMPGGMGGMPGGMGGMPGGMGGMPDGMNPDTILNLLKSLDPEIASSLSDPQVMEATKDMFMGNKQSKHSPEVQGKAKKVMEQIQAKMGSMGMPGGFS